MSAIHRIFSIPKRILVKFSTALEHQLVRRGAQSRFWSTVYYAFYRSDYVREQAAFLAGRIAYEKSLKCPSGNMAVLRRNVHRIEKGLLMRPRRSPFALDYMPETVDAFLTARTQPMDNCEMAWARDVLAEYFRVNPDHPAINPHRIRFQNSQNPDQADAPSLIPYRRNLSSPLVVNYESLYQLARHRRSVRWFLQKPVPREIIDRSIELAAQAPSACNRQPFEFRIFDDLEVVRQVASIPFGLGGYGHNVPCLAVVVGKQRNFSNERDRHLIYIDASLAVMGLLYALEVQGVSTCCVNWPDVAEREKRMSSLLRLALDERPVMLVAIGYPDPDGMVANSAKKSLPNLRRYNFE
jgi:nitroreductase